MSVDIEPEEPLMGLSLSGRWLRVLWHRLTVRFVLVIGVLIFLTVVSIDSSRQQASAADMPAVGQPTPTPLSLTAESPQTISHKPVSVPARTYLEFDPKTAARLSHSDLTSASMTRSRLTSAHFFTQKVR